MASDSLLDAAYDFSESGCTWLQGDGVSTACQYYCYYLTVMVLHDIAALWKGLRKANTRFGSVLKMIPIEVQKIADFKITRLSRDATWTRFEI